MTSEAALQLAGRPSDDIEIADIASALLVKIERYATRGDRAGKSISRYHVSIVNESPWDIEIVRAGHRYCWTLDRDVQLFEKNHGHLYATHQEALDAAVRYVQDLETGMW